MSRRVLIKQKEMLMIVTDEKTEITIQDASLDKALSVLNEALKLHYDDPAFNEPMEMIVI